MPSARPRTRVGISACLLGRKVGHDGGHKRDTCITFTLGRLFEWVPVRPEVEPGLGAPRETLRDAERRDRCVRNVLGCSLLRNLAVTTAGRGPKPGKHARVGAGAGPAVT